jgi:hypothetical protein
LPGLSPSEDNFSLTKNTIKNTIADGGFETLFGENIDAVSQAIRQEILHVTPAMGPAKFRQC